MGTRHLICVVQNGEYKVAQYGQWDGYPSGQGACILDFLKQELEKDNLANFRSKVKLCKFATEEYIKNLDEYKHYPELSRDTGSDILKFISNSENGLVLYNDIKFAADSLFCEWCYVIDLDNNTLEVYEGFNKKPLGKEERFHFLNKAAYKEHREEQYYPVKFVTGFDFECLPETDDEFCELIDEIIEKENEDAES